MPRYSSSYRWKNRRSNNWTRRGPMPKRRGFRTPSKRPSRVFIPYGHDNERAYLRHVNRVEHAANVITRNARRFWDRRYQRWYDEYLNDREYDDYDRDGGYGSVAR